MSFPMTGDLPRKDMMNKSSYGTMGKLESNPCSFEKLSGGFTVADANGEFDSLRSVRLIQL